MKMSKFRNVLGMALLALFFAGCTTTGGSDDGEGAPVDDATAGGGVSGDGAYADGATTSGASASGSWNASDLNDPSSPLYDKTVYFSFDGSLITAEYDAMLRAHANYLLANPAATVTIAGHCDERGTREYNIALGERRANAVLRFLESEGVSPSQMATISYGEEEPVSLGHNESAWSQNRRAVLVY